MTEMDESARNCGVCGTVSSERCSGCHIVGYCGRDHQKQAWPQHKYSCHEPYQMGLYAAGQSSTVTPIFIPKSTGNIQTLARNSLARLLSCAANEVELLISPMSTLFGPDHRIVCAYRGGLGGLMQGGTSASNTSRELCFRAVHMTRPLANGSGPQIHGNALFFYLQPGKNFLVSPDFSAAQAVIEAWNLAHGNNSPEALQRLTEVFATEVTKPITPGSRIDWFNTIIFPALERKPFITKHPFRYMSSDGPWTAPFHHIETQYVMGDTHLGSNIMERASSPGHTPDRLRIHMRDSFLTDGSPINQSIQVATRGAARHRWAGNIVILKYHGESELGTDADAGDVDAAIDYFRRYASDM